jgi:dTDP-4-dehydrorhamnose 3,5-epimerase
MIIGTQDKQSITIDGKVLLNDIDGLIIHHTPPIIDERGEVVEVYRPTWGLSNEPLVYTYMVSIRPNAIKGWVVHSLQDDRIFVMNGVQLWAFFDNREDSPTYKNFLKITITDRNRALIIIPKGVYHAVKNIGNVEAQFINMPTRPYDRENPDKYRLPIKNEIIPFDFSDNY